jgi:hypothetical protein
VNKLLHQLKRSFLKDIIFVIQREFPIVSTSTPLGKAKPTEKAIMVVTRVDIVKTTMTGIETSTEVAVGKEEMTGINVATLEETPDIEIHSLHNLDKDPDQMDG